MGWGEHFSPIMGFFLGAEVRPLDRAHSPATPVGQAGGEGFGPRLRKAGNKGGALGQGATASRACGCGRARSQPPSPTPPAGPAGCRLLQPQG